jgi:hypothetical protein
MADVFEDKAFLLGCFWDYLGQIRPIWDAQCSRIVRAPPEALLFYLIAGSRWEALCVPVLQGSESELDGPPIRIRRYNDPRWPTPISSSFNDSQPNV